MDAEGLHALYTEARALTAASLREQQRREEEERAAHEAAVAAAQDRLLGRLLNGLEDRVREAASEGKREVELLVFEGNETFDGEFFYLYLLKGPRDRRGARVVPLLRTMQQSLAPFSVKHIWKLGTTQNQVVLAWDM